MTGQTRLLENRWDDAYAAKLDEPGKLLYRSNLLGADKRITNYGGGNTSAKVMETDPLTGENEFAGADVGLLLGNRQDTAEAAERDPKNPTTWGKVGRNEACPCGSGKKYKHCHGRYA